MIDWYRQRARQERAMAMRTKGREALCAHNALYRDLLRQCNAQADRPNSICDLCDLRLTCWTLAAISTRRAAVSEWRQRIAVPAISVRRRGKGTGRAHPGSSS